MWEGRKGLRSIRGGNRKVNHLQVREFLLFLSLGIPSATTNTIFLIITVIVVAIVVIVAAVVITIVVIVVIVVRIAIIGIDVEPRNHQPLTSSAS